MVFIDMNTIIIFLCVFNVCFLANAQSNLLAKSDFDNITINNVSLQSIFNTHGRKSNVISIFGNPVSENIDSDNEFFIYSYNGLRLGFSSLISNGTIEKPVISRIEITNSDWIVKIGNDVFKVGDSILRTGPLETISRENGKQAIVYRYCENCNNQFLVIFDEQNGRVSRILYYERT